MQPQLLKTKLSEKSFAALSETKRTFHLSQKIIPLLCSKDQSYIAQIFVTGSDPLNESRSGLIEGDVNL